ncbi:MAG: HlyC/CorC family transporter [Opitutales bacterium]|nr:HlyC/CorC family transporter [Opitutales bacterium]
MNTVLFDILPTVLSGLIVLGLHGLLASCEFSLLKLRFAQVPEDWAAALKKTPALERLLDEADRGIRVVRLFLAVTLIALTVFWVPMLAHYLADLEHSWRGSTTALPWLIAILVVLLIHQLVGEVIPRALGLAFPLQSLRAGAAVLIVFEWVSRPLHGGLHHLAQLLWRLAMRSKEKMPSLDSLSFEAQLESICGTDQAGLLQRILRNAVNIRELVVSDVLLPRNQVKYIDLNEPVPENLKMARESGHTRFPLCMGDLDHCIGLIHIKDLFRYSGNLEKADLRWLKRDIIRIDSEEPLESALSKLLSHRMHMALVIDEFRGTEGVLTLERVLEQVVGEIQDEFDNEEELRIRPEDEGGSAVVSGLTPIHELEQTFGLDIDNDTVSTLGGLITSEIGRIPEQGEVIQVEGLEVTVTEVDETRVIEARVRLLVDVDDNTPMD